MFKDYLKETWMLSAMKKLIACRQQIDYELYKLGIVADAPESTREVVAAREVERRFAGIMKHVRDSFNQQVLKVLRDELNARVDSFHVGGATENPDVADKLATFEGDIRIIVASAVAKIRLHWSGKIHGALTAETMETKSNGKFSLTTIIPDLGMCLPVFNTVSSSMELYYRAKELNDDSGPFIQLSQYSQYTDAIKIKCDDFLIEVQRKIVAKAATVLDRFMACDSPWLSLIPDAMCEKVSADILVGPFVNAVVGAFVRESPPDCAFNKLHNGVPLGTERADAQKRLEILREKNSDVEGAVIAIKEAFSLSEEEVDTISRDVEWNPTAEVCKLPPPSCLFYLFNLNNCTF
jgi:hypothetical protein